MEYRLYSIMFLSISAQAGRCSAGWREKTDTRRSESSRLLRLPMYYGLTDEDIDTVTDAVKEFYSEQRYDTKGA